MKISNPGKILYPEDGITKLQIAEYYAAIQNYILPYIINRPLTLVRCPESYQDCFYQKHINKSTPPELRGVNIKEKHKTELYIYIDDALGLLALAQMGVLEIHPWGSTIASLEQPDIVIFDLDPAPNVAWEQVVATAFKLKDLLTEYGLESFVKTTGGKGLHVVAPIQPEYDWEHVKIFSNTMVDYLVMQYPDQYINVMTKAKRSGKIFIDYMRNDRGATAIAPYSTRARTHATVATPLAWNELKNNTNPISYNINTVINRLKKLKQDPWQDFFSVKQSLRLDEFS